MSLYDYPYYSSDSAYRPQKQDINDPEYADRLIISNRIDNLYPFPIIEDASLHSTMARCYMVASLRGADHDPERKSICNAIDEIMLLSGAIRGEWAPF